MGFSPNSGSLSGASDVAFSNPSAGHDISYDAGTAKWVNASLTKARVGLANVDNTSDVSKPISTATQAALNAKLGTNWNVKPVIYANSQTTWPSRTVPTGYSGPVTWDSMAYPDHPDPTTMVAGDDWLRRIS